MKPHKDVECIHIRKCLDLVSCRCQRTEVGEGVVLTYKVLIKGYDNVKEVSTLQITPDVCKVV